MSEFTFPKGTVAIVTGASRGIGYETAIGLARSGAHIVAVARTEAGLEDLDDAVQAVGSTATLVPFDLCSGDGIESFAKAIVERFGRTDILVGAAGELGPLAPTAHITPETWRQIMEINFIANQRLLRAFDGPLRAAPHGRVVLVSSGAAHKNNSYWGPYASSKIALERMGQIYAHEVGMTSLKVNIVDPGATRTRMRAEAFPGEDPATLKSPKSVAEFILKFCYPNTQQNGEVLRVPS